MIEVFNNTFSLCSRIISTSDVYGKFTLSVSCHLLVNVKIPCIEGLPIRSLYPKFVMKYLECEIINMLRCFGVKQTWFFDIYWSSLYLVRGQKKLIFCLSFIFSLILSCFLINYHNEIQSTSWFKIFKSLHVNRQNFIKIVLEIF